MIIQKYTTTIDKRDTAYKTQLGQAIDGGFGDIAKSIDSQKKLDFLLAKQVVDKSIMKAFYLAAGAEQGYAYKVEKAVAEGKSGKLEQAEGWAFYQSLYAYLSGEGGAKADADYIMNQFDLKTNPKDIKASEINQVFVRGFALVAKSEYKQSFENFDKEKGPVTALNGSTDHTVDAAIEAGADHVISTPRRRGLGAAVREGLREAYRLGADLAVMIDADDEYPAEYIPQATKPLLEGSADYVLASRFAGRIDGMKLHRRYGNYVFTALQMVLLRRVITDGQTGFRAFSRGALDKLDIIHDYNYAQVMTLNLVRQGFRMAEVPIPYKVRTTGSSFIRFWPYVSKVLPAVYREMRRKPGGAASESWPHAQLYSRLGLQGVRPQ